MDYFENDSPKKAIISPFPNSNKFNQTNKYNNERNSYFKLLNPEIKPNIKSIYKSNNQNFHDINYKNNEYQMNQIKENPKMLKFLTEYYSFPFKNLNLKYNNNLSKSKDQNINTNDLLMHNKYSLNSNPNNNNYMGYSPNQRLTFNYKGKNEFIQNIIESNSTTNNMYPKYSKENKYLLNPNKKINKCCNQCKQYEKTLLLNKLNNSKSTNNFYGEDILIEYNNVPIINKKQNINKGYLDNYLNKSNDYLFKNTNSNQNNFSYANSNNSSIEKNNNNKNLFYIKNDYNKTNQEKKFLGKSYFDVNISNVSNMEENYDFNTSKNHNDFFSQHNNWQFSRKNNNTKNNNIFDINNNLTNNYNMNIYESKTNENTYQLNKSNTGLFKKHNQIKKNINNYKVININKSIYLNNNEIEKNNNTTGQNKKNYKTKSKKDIFTNKEYTNIIKLGNQKFKKRISPEPKNKICYNACDININMNNPKTTKNYLNNKNILYHEIFDKKLVSNKRNSNGQNNLYKCNLLTEKNINNQKLYDIMIRENKDTSYTKYETSENTNNTKANMITRNTNNSHYQNTRENFNYLEAKNNTSRYANLRLENRNLVLSSENSKESCFSSNNYGYKSSKTTSHNKKINKINFNKCSQKGKISASSVSNVVARNTHNNKKNNINIILEENNQREKKDYNDISSKTEASVQQADKNDKNKLNNNTNNIIRNANYFSILKNICLTNNNLPVKLYLKKKQMKNKNGNDKKYNNSMNENNNFDNKTYKINMIRQVKNILNNKSVINKNIINSKNQNNFKNNNNINEKENILTEEKNQINISNEQKEKIKSIYPNKNKNSIFNKKGNIKIIKNKTNIKTITNELLEKNKNIKAFKIISPSINRNINKSNSIINNYPSYIQNSIYDIKNNNSYNIIAENYSKSYKNIYKGNFSENNRTIKQMIFNNSSRFLTNENHKFNIEQDMSKSTDKIKPNFFRDTVIPEKNNLNRSNLEKNNRNYKISKDNINISKIIRSPTIRNNLNPVFFKEKIKKSITQNLKQANPQNSKNNNNSGVYIKPFGIMPKSKSKSKKCKKSKSVIKISKNNNSDRNIIEKKILKRNKSNFGYYFKTSPLFFQKDEYFQSEFCSIKKGSTSLNSSHVTKCENSSFKTFENNSTIINFIKEPFKKEYFFTFKFYNYFIKLPKNEQCYFNKTNICKKDQNESIEEVVNTMRNSRTTFRNFNQNSYKNIKFSESNQELNNIENLNSNDIEESGLDIYKELHKTMQNNQEEKSNNDKQFPITKESLIHETIKKLKNLSRDYNKIKTSSTNEKKLNEENNSSKLSKTFDKYLKYTNLQNGIKILDNLARKRGLKRNDENLNNYLISENNEKKGEKIFLGTNKLNEIFNSRRETDYTNLDNYGEEQNSKNKPKDKISKSLNKDIIKGISKIENVFGKINSTDSDEQNKIYNIEKDFEYKQEQKQKISTYIPKRRNELNLTKDKSEINSNFEETEFNEYCKEISLNPKYKQNQLFLKKVLKDENDENQISNNKEIKYNDCLNAEIKNTEISNHYKETISNSEEDNINNNDNKQSSEECKKSSKNNSSNSEEFDNYLKIIKKNKSNDILNKDLTFLLNIISKGNYYFCLKQITQIILYDITKSKNPNLSTSKKLKNNNDIIFNEHLFINIIFKQIAKGTKCICIYSELCADLNQNILKDLSEQKNMKNNKERNLKIIINEKCIEIINGLKKEELDLMNIKDSFEIYTFKCKIKGFVTFVIELIKIEILKLQFGLYVLEQLYKLLINENENTNYSIVNIYLEGIIILINKLGKLIFGKNNQKLLQNINNYIVNNLLPILDDKKSQKNIQTCLKYKIINLISKKENQWIDTLYDIYEEEKKIIIIPDNKSNLSKNIIENKELDTINKPLEQSLKDINKALIKEDIMNYISYFSEETNKGKINIKSYVDKSYNWKVIDELVNNKNFGLESIVNYFISICSTINYDDNKIILCNDYIKNIIEFYANNLSKKAIESIHNEMIKTFSDIDSILEQNKNMFKILGNLLFVLIDNKLFLIKFFNHYLKVDTKTQINLAIITKYCIISAGKFAKKYLNDFKQTKLFNNNEIFEKYVIENMKDLLYFIK